MIGSNLHFEMGDRVRIEGKDYLVDGIIHFLNESDGCSWAEYQLKDIDTLAIRWLSVDNGNREYAIYTQEAKNSQISQDSILAGYKQVDCGRAQVTSIEGNVEAADENWVEFTEYEDATEEKIIAVEKWEDEVEYSRGYYLDQEDIRKLTSNNAGYEKPNEEVHTVFKNVSSAKAPVNFEMLRKIPLEVYYVVIGVIVIFLVGGGFSSGGSTIKKQIEKDKRFTYVSSMTADFKNSKKADVYTTELTAEQAAKVILDFTTGNVQNVDENPPDGSVAIITKKEYCLIYTGEDKKTFVQISSREYVYYSSHSPYHSYGHIGSFYRRFYYSTAYEDDRRHYGGISAYQNYTDGKVSVNNNNRYKQYSDTIRQESTAARESSGGGTSVGK